MLILGDDGGDIFILRFLRPTSSLFKKLVIDRKQVMMWQVRVSFGRTGAFIEVTLQRMQLKLMPDCTNVNEWPM